MCHVSRTKLHLKSDLTSDRHIKKSVTVSQRGFMFYSLALCACCVILLRRLLKAFQKIWLTLWFMEEKDEWVIE